MTMRAPGSVIIIVGGRQVGAAVQQAGMFHFFATDPSFELLDGSAFRRLDQVELAARHLWRAVRQRDDHAAGELPGVERRHVTLRASPPRQHH
jgi:hypothetical protein